MGSGTPVSRDRVVMSRGRPLLRTSALAKKSIAAMLRTKHIVMVDQTRAARETMSRGTHRVKRSNRRSRYLDSHPMATT